MNNLEENVSQAVEKFIQNAHSLPKDTVYAFDWEKNMPMILTSSKNAITVLFHFECTQRLSIKLRGGQVHVELESIPEVHSPDMHVQRLKLLYSLMTNLYTVLKTSQKIELLDFVQSCEMSEMETIFMRALHQGGLDINFLNTINNNIVGQWQDAWGKGLLNNPNAIKNGWNASLVMLAIMVHCGEKSLDSKFLRNSGMDDHKSNAFMKTMQLDQYVNLREWLKNHEPYMTAQQYAQLQNVVLQLDMDVFALDDPGNIATWWRTNRVSEYMPPLDLPETT